MKLVGKNRLVLNKETLCNIVADAYNAQTYNDRPKVRVNSVTRLVDAEYFSFEIEVVPTKAAAK
jgi:hypothetical protein